MQRRDIRRRLREYCRQAGNWRLKGLFLAHQTNARAVGEAWPTDADERRHLQAHAHGPTAALSAKHSVAHRPDSNEDAVARSLADHADEKKALTVGAGIDKDEYISRALINESVTELDVLFREEITESIIMGAQGRRIARDAATVTTVNSRRGDLPVQETDKYGSDSAESAQGEMINDGYTTAAYDCQKFSLGFELTDELVDQATPDIIEQKIEATGAGLEGSLNRVFINTVIDDATQEHDTGGSEQDITMVSAAMEKLADQDFDPADTLVIHPEFRSSIQDSAAVADLNLTRSDVDGGPAFYNGLEPFVMSGSAYDGSNTYGFEADGELGAAVYPRNRVHVVIYQDVSISEFENPVRDIQGAMASLYTDTVLADTNSVARIEF